MKRYLSLIFVGIALLVFAENKIPDCNQGDQNKNIPSPKSHPLSNYNPEGKLSVDPNEIIGPTGVDSVRWISINDILKYTIMFENDPEFATAAAQRVDVRFDFPNKALQKNFGIGTYCFSNMSYNVENSPNAYQNRINLVDSLGIYVDVIGGLDVTQNQGFWNFSTIDPETGYAPWEHDKGLLQVNDSTHVGEGFVTFSLKPLANMQTGDTISIQARIVFDDNDTIPTNRWCNMIDAGMPVSKTIATINSEDPTCYNISFESSDDKGGSGVGKIALYLANNSGLYEEYGVYAPDSIVSFPIEQGKQYKLFSIATDKTGNMEPLKEEPDVVVNFNQPPTDLLLSNTIFQDDVELDGFIAELSSDDDDDDVDFTYALAEGDGAIHNDMFAVVGNRLQANDCFKCANDSIYKIRLSTTDNGGLQFSKSFTLKMLHVLDNPEPQTYDVEICDGDYYEFFGETYDKTGTFTHRVPNEFMCDSIYVLNLRLIPIPEPPVVSVSDNCTLTSSAEKGNLWYKDGEPIDDATDQVFVASQSGVYYVTVSNGGCESEPSDEYKVVFEESSDLELSFAEGWSWISHNNYSPLSANVLMSDININRILSQTEEVIRDPKLGVTGLLDKLNPTECYKVETSDATNATIKGGIHWDLSTPIPIHTGWNWIGYPVSQIMEINDALAATNAEKLDIIVGQEGFAQFDGNVWVGTLECLNPGSGYLYQSQSDKNIVYSTSAVTKVKSNHTVGVLMSAFTVDIHKYPSVMPVIATITGYYDEHLNNSSFQVFAFSGSECRGIGKVVNGLVMMNVYGNPKDDIIFKVLDLDGITEYKNNTNLKFEESAVGNLDNPFPIRITDFSGVDIINDESLVSVCQEGDMLKINGIASKDIDIVEIYNTEGRKFLSEDNVINSRIRISHIAGGVYIVIVKGNGEYSYHKIVIQ